MKTNLTDALQRKCINMTNRNIKYSKFSRNVKHNSSNMNYHVQFFVSNLISMALELWILTKITYHAQMLIMELIIQFLCILSAYVIIVPMVTWYWDNQLILLNSLRPSDAIWWHRSESILAQEMACCLTAPSHYLNQCWLVIRKIQLHSCDGNFTRDTSVINDWN